MSSHEQVLAEVLYWKKFLSESITQEIIAKKLSLWSPWDYLMNLDGTTRFSVVLALIVCSYILFSSVWRFSRMILSIFAFLMQFAFVALVVVLSFQYRDVVAANLEQLLGKFDS